MIILDTDSKTPLYLQIYNQFKDQISSGEIQEGITLPSIRSLAKTIQVSRNTIENAYHQLSSEGYISSKICSGYIVQKVESKLYSEITAVSNITEKKSLKQFHDQGVSNKVKYDFQYGRLNPSEFPLRIWRKMLNQALLSSDIDCLTAYNDRMGELNLRIEIMKYLNDSRGVKCQPDQIILCSGTLSCLSLICQLLIKTTNTIAIEDPCYDSARSVLINHGFNVLPIPLQEDGINLKFLEASSAKVVFTTPSHQFPTGSVIPINKRLNLIKWAEKNNSYIIEDDYDSELRYNSRPIPSIQSLDNNGRVIYINTFSKAFAPGLRLSFIVLPPLLLEKYQSSFSKYNCSVPWLEQKVMYNFMHEGYWNRHLRKISQSNKKKHDTLIRSINEIMRKYVKIHGKNAGLHILLEVNNGMTEKELIEKAEIVNVKMYPVSNYWANLQNYSNNMVLIGFSGLSESDIVEGIKLLSSAWF